MTRSSVKTSRHENGQAEPSEESGIFSNVEILHFIQDDRKNGFAIASRSYESGFYLPPFIKLGLNLAGLQVMAGGKLKYLLIVT
jgi:hypothetical protein